jgi:DNA polymerase-4
MSFACVLIQHFPVEAEILRQPELKSQPIVIARSTGDKSEVVDFAPSLKGLQVGMLLREALVIVGAARVLEADLPYYRTAYQDILAAFLRLSPMVEDAGLGQAYVGLAGLEALYGSDARLALALGRGVPPAFGARVGVGDSKFIAYLAAYLATPGGAFKAPEDSKGFAQLFPVDYLPVDVAVQQRLRLFGLETLKDVASVGIGPLQTYFGAAGKLIWELSNGIDARPILPLKEEPEIRESLSFPYETASLEMLCFSIEALLRRAFSRPEMRGRFASIASLECSIVGSPRWIRSFNFKEAVGSPERAMFSIRSRLEGDMPRAAFDEVTLAISCLSGEPGTQASLLKEVKDACQARLVDLARGMRARGMGGLYRITQVDPRYPLPEMRAFQVPVDPLAAQELRPLSMATPVNVLGAPFPEVLAIGGRRIKVVGIQDLWRVNLWWLPTPVERLYLRVTGEDNTLITVFRNQGTGEWFRQSY